MTSLDDDLLALTMQQTSASSADAVAALRDALWRRLHAEGWKPALHPTRADGGPPIDDDRSLLRAFIHGDTHAFGALVRRHGGDLLGYAMRWVSKDQAEDFAQIGFLVLFRKAAEVLAKPDQEVRAYVFTVVRNEVCSTYRRDLRRQELLEAHALELVPDAGPDPFDLILQRERAELLPLLVTHCNPLMQDVVLMALAGKSNSEIAKALDLETKHVAVLKHRARVTLSRIIAPKGEP